MADVLEFNDISAEIKGAMVSCSRLSLTRSSSKLCEGQRRHGLGQDFTSGEALVVLPIAGVPGTMLMMRAIASKALEQQITQHPKLIVQGPNVE